MPNKRKNKRGQWANPYTLNIFKVTLESGLFYYHVNYTSETLPASAGYISCRAALRDHFITKFTIEPMAHIVIVSPKVVSAVSRKFIANRYHVFHGARLWFEFPDGIGDLLAFINSIKDKTNIDYTIY